MFNHKIVQNKNLTLTISQRHNYSLALGDFVTVKPTDGQIKLSFRSTNHLRLYCNLHLNNMYTYMMPEKHY